MLTSLVHFRLGLKTQKDIFQRCHGNSIVDDSQVGLTVKLREQAYNRNSIKKSSTAFTEETHTMHTIYELLWFLLLFLL